MDLMERDIVTADLKFATTDLQNKRLKHYKPEHHAITGRYRPSTKGALGDLSGWTMNVKFCEDNSGNNALPISFYGLW